MKKQTILFLMIMLLAVNVQAYVDDITANSDNNPNYSPYRYYIQNADSYSDLDVDSPHTKSYYAGRNLENDYKFKYRYDDYNLAEQRRLAKKVAKGDNVDVYFNGYPSRYDSYRAYSDGYRYSSPTYDRYGRSLYDSYNYGNNRRYNDPRSTYYNRPYTVTYEAETETGSYGSYNRPGSYNENRIYYHYSNY